MEMRSTIFSLVALALFGASACQGEIRGGEGSALEPVFTPTGGSAGSLGASGAAGSTMSSGGSGGSIVGGSGGSAGGFASCATGCGPGSVCENGACVCQPGLMDCQGECVNTQTDGNDCGSCGNVCGDSQTCENGVCKCSDGLVGCASGCTDLQTDNFNCGTCGTTCQPGEVCSSGSCSCIGGLSPCPSGCQNLMSDPLNCGACGTQCPTGQVCSGGQCQANCQGNETLCNQQSCVNTASDPENCGGCGKACPAGQICEGGQCRCTGDLTSCGGTCVDLDSHPSNCGSCGNSCGTGRTCSGGSCVCINGQSCNGQCVDTQSDATNCGSCGNVCTGGRICSGGQCVCPPNQTPCNGQCVNTQTSSSNCGSCGTTCVGGSCANGSCTCSGGETPCNNQCKNLQTDPQNCGSCGNQCATGQSCSGGKCSGGNPTGKVFGQCRFHFGTVDSVAKNDSGIRSQIDFFTPGWMGYMDTFDQSYVCNDGNPGGLLANQVPIVVAYVSAFYVKRHHPPLCDCNVYNCGSSNGRPNDLCNYGAQYIQQDLSAILNVYRSYAQGYANCYGTTRPIVFAMEPDWYQYTASTQTDPLTPSEAGNIMGQFVAAIKQYLPNAVFSMDISPWVGNNGADNGQQWYSNFNMSNFTFINTSGGSTLAANTKIRAENNMTWAGVSNVTGKPILADTGYGAAGVSAGHDSNWDVPANINARMNDGVVSISQYNPKSDWENTISQIRNQLNTPKFCP